MRPFAVSNLPQISDLEHMETKAGIRRNFARRAASYDAHAGVQRFMGQKLLTAVAACLPRARRILEIGCGTGYFTGLLHGANPRAHLVALDLDTALVESARRRLGPEAGVSWLVADGEELAAGGFDLIIANATLQWFRRPGATLAQYCRSLNPGGILAFSTLGPGTFQELAAALRQAAERLHSATAPEIPAARFLDREAWASRLNRAGFAWQDLHQENHLVTWPSVQEFLKNLQATGATNPRPQPFSPRFLRALLGAYQALPGANGAIPVTYDLIFALAQK